MFFNTGRNQPAGGSDAILGLGRSADGSSPFAVETLARVRSALTVAPVKPLTRADWAELRATVSARRPSPPPRLFSHAPSFFDR